MTTAPTTCDAPPVLSQTQQSSQPRPYVPLQPDECIAVLDVLRGFALSGILVMNMKAFDMHRPPRRELPRGQRAGELMEA